MWYPRSSTPKGVYLGADLDPVRDPPGAVTNAARRGPRP